MMKETLVRVTILVAMLCMGPWFATAQPVNSRGTDDLQNKISTMKLEDLLDYIDQHPQYSFPAIHTRLYYKNDLTQEEKGNLDLGIALDQVLEKSIQHTITLKPGEMDIELRRLSKLRDKLWQSSKVHHALGNFMLCDLADRLIFWCNVSQATTNPKWSQEKGQEGALRYAFVIQDWKTASLAWSLEVKGTINLQAVIAAPCEKPNVSQGVINLASKYRAIAIQLKQKTHALDANNLGISSVVPPSVQEVLQTGNIDSFFSHIIGAYNSKSPLNARHLMLRTYKTFADRARKISGADLSKPIDMLRFLKKNREEANKGLVGHNFPCLEGPLSDMMFAPSNLVTLLQFLNEDFQREKSRYPHLEQSLI